MKDRIKKFFKDHEDQVAIATSIAGASAFALGVFGLYKVRGLKIEGVYSCAEEKCMDHVYVVLKNGQSRQFTRPHT